MSPAVSDNKDATLKLRVTLRAHHDCAVTNGKGAMVIYRTTRCCHHTKRTGCWRRAGVSVFSLSVAKSLNAAGPHQACAETNGKDAMVKLHTTHREPDITQKNAKFNSEAPKTDAERVSTVELTALNKKHFPGVTSQ